MKRDGPKAPSTIHGLSGLRFLPTEEANAIADCLENRFTPHDLCDERHEERVETCVQALLEVEDDTVTERVRPCDMQKIICTLNLGEACRLEWYSQRMPQAPSEKTTGSSNSII
jgi:hypothetical protein